MNMDNKKSRFEIAVNPFIRIAGGKALAIGLAGMLLSAIVAISGDVHYHGLLHYGPAVNNAWWTHAVEVLAVWLVPAVLFYLGGWLRSKSQIRAVDVFGTVAFAQIPLLVVNLLMITPPMQQMAELAIDANNIGQLLADHQLLVMSTLMTLLQIPFVVLMLLWMVMAVKVSCNLKSWALVGVYAVGIIGGDILSRIVISYIV